MSRSRSARAALSRALLVLFVLAGALVGMAGTSLAASAGQVAPSTSISTVSSGPAVAGVSLGTLTWALVGFLLLVLGFIGASRSGRRAPAPAGPGPVSAGSARFQTVTHEAQGEPTSAAVTV